MKGSLCFLLLALSVACAPFTTEPFQRVTLGPPEYIYIPAIGTQYETSVGSTMVEYYTGRAAEGFIAFKTFPPKSLTVDPGITYFYDAIPYGSEWAIVGTLSNGDFLCQNNQYPGATFNGIRFKEHPLLMVSHKNEEMYGYASEVDYNRVAVFEWRVKPDNFIKKASRVYLKNNDRCLLIYNGKSGQTLHITYREFSEDQARPAFDQELSYNLSEGNIIGFRGMQIEIITATNSSIQFKITQGFH